jgi:branched-chain amino acid transport system substrate-binding protein
MNQHYLGPVLVTPHRPVSFCAAFLPKTVGGFYADILLVTSRLNDAMLITRELVKQRWTPQGILSMGPGWFQDQYLKTLGKLSDGPMSFTPWQDPNKKLTLMLEAALAKA